MQKTQAERMRDFFRLIENSDIAKFLDLNKFRKSDEFLVICRYASRHAKETGDVGFMLKILLLFEGTT